MGEGEKNLVCYDIELARKQALQETGNLRLLDTAEIKQLLTMDSAAFGTQMEALKYFVPDKLSIKGFWYAQRPYHLWFKDQLEAASKSEFIIQRFAEDINRGGGRLVLIYTPHPFQIGPTECALGRYYYNIADNVILPARSGTQEWLAQVAERHGIELLDPTRAMRDYSVSVSSHVPLLYLRRDCHWSKTGHRFMAKFLADWFVK